jgi:hypothetical protein
MTTKPTTEAVEALAFALAPGCTNLSDEGAKALLARLAKSGFTITRAEPTPRRLSDAPCDQCGYNGPGYYQPITHPCAQAHHDASYEDSRVGGEINKVVHDLRLGKVSTLGATNILLALAKKYRRQS